MIRVGLYNRYLSTMGGGEKYSLGIAERISKYFPVDYISHKPVSREAAAKRFELDLSRVNFVVTPELTSQTLPALTQKYDLFINASYMDFFPSLAKHSAAVIFFPAKLNLQIAFRRALKNAIRKLFDLPEFVVGMQRFEMAANDLNWFMDSTVKIKLPAAARDYCFRFNISGLDEKIRNLNIELDRELVGCIPLDSKTPVTYEVVLSKQKQQGYHELVLTTDPPEDVTGEARVLINHLDLSLPSYQAYRRLFENSYGRTIGYKLNYYPPAFSILDFLKTYDVVWGISEYTRKWIRRYWHRDCTLLYPSVNVKYFYSAPKKPIILNVGRFFAGQHNKKHLEMIQAFKKMVDRGLTGWELHMAGGVDPRPEHQEYFQSVLEAAKGYPIFIHANLPLEDLLPLYAESAIYWHASGYGENENRDPEKFEHFGITTLEAMAASCCPVVIGKGGQPEIVDHGVNGFLWQTLEELQSMTLKLIQDPALRERVSARARETSLKFDKSHFNEQVDEFLYGLGLISKNNSGTVERVNENEQIETN